MIDLTQAQSFIKELAWVKQLAQRNLVKWSHELPLLFKNLKNVSIAKYYFIYCVYKVNE